MSMKRTIVECPKCYRKSRVPYDRGDLEVKCGHCSYVWEWDSLDALKDNLSKEDIRKIIEEKVSAIKNYTPRVAIFGVTGVGKSSLCNALFGQEIAKISDVAAGTRAPQEIKLTTGSGKEGITLIDVPGLGETEERDKEYLKLYESLVINGNIDLILWIIKADDRAYAISQNAYNRILKPNLKNCPVLFVINQVDKIEPLFDWDQNKNVPGPKKQANINLKVDEVSKAFNVSKRKIVTTSAMAKYNLSTVMEAIVDILPNEKKFSAYREAKEEVVTEAIAEKAETGVWAAIKEGVGAAYEVVREVVVEVAAETLARAGRKLFSSIRGLFR